VLHFVKIGQLRIVRREKPAGQHGRVWYDGDDVAEIKRTWQRRRRRPTRKETPAAVSAERGRVAKIAYPMFRDGGSDADVVIATGADPVLVRQLRRLFSTSLEDDLRAERRAKVEEEQLRAAREHERTRRVEIYADMQVQKTKAAERAAADSARAARRAARRASKASPITAPEGSST
jgi:hypothetical protein